MGVKSITQIEGLRMTTESDTSPEPVVAPQKVVPLVPYPDFSSAIGILCSAFGLLLGACTLGYEYKKFGDAK